MDLVKRNTRVIAGLLLGGAAIISILALAGIATGDLRFAAWVRDTVPMKDKTAGIILVHVAIGLLICRRDRRSFGFPICLTALVTILFALGLVHEIRTLENLASFNPTASFFPSVMTVLASVFLAIKALASLFFRSRIPAVIASTAVAIIGASALIGYAINFPAMYFFIPGRTTAMAVNTAATFLLLGCSPISHVEVQ